MNDPTGMIVKQLIGSHNEINGKYVDIKVAEDGKTREKVETSSCKIFVGGIEGTVSTEELKDFFSNYGEVKEAVVLRNIQTNASRGFGFVTFEDSRMADQLIRENNCVLKGKRMDVKPAEPKENSAPRGEGNMRGGFDQMNDRGGDMRQRDYGPPQDDYQPRHRGGGGYQQRGYTPRNEYVQQEPSYAPSQYDHYSAPMQPQSRYGGYNVPDPAQAPVATIAPYAPPSKNTYQSNYIQPQPQPQQQQQMYGGYGGQPMQMGRESKVHMGHEYPRRDNRDQMYANKGYSPGGHPPSHQPSSHQPSGHQAQSYGSHYNKGHNDQFYSAGGPSRDYGSQNKGHRYKPY
jgi:RNA recognition motif-containing protein